PAPARSAERATAARFRREQQQAAPQSSLGPAGTAIYDGPAVGGSQDYDGGTFDPDDEREIDYADNPGHRFSILDVDDDLADDAAVPQSDGPAAPAGGGLLVTLAWLTLFAALIAAVGAGGWWLGAHLLMGP